MGALFFCMGLGTLAGEVGTRLWPVRDMLGSPTPFTIATADPLRPRAAPGRTLDPVVSDAGPSPLAQGDAAFTDEDPQADLLLDGPHAPGPDHEPPAPRIAIVIDDLGLDARATREAIALPERHTLAFLPYGRQVSALAREAGEAGHELIVHVPMEPLGPEHPGPRALTMDLGDEELLDRLDWAFSRFEGFAGFNNHMGSRLTQDARRMSLVMRHARKWSRAAGQDAPLYFLDSITSSASRAGHAAQVSGLKTLRRDVFLDHVIDREQIIARLKDVQRIADDEGEVVAIGHPHRLTLGLLRDWIIERAEEGYAFVPVSALIDAPQDDAPLVAQY